MANENIADDFGVLGENIGLNKHMRYMYIK